MRIYILAILVAFAALINGLNTDEYDTDGDDSDEYDTYGYDTQNIYDRIKSGSSLKEPIFCIVTFYRPKNGNWTVQFNDKCDIEYFEEGYGSSVKQVNVYDEKLNYYRENVQ
ncbi:hypothetical protein DFJ63DRAFT_102060 [Scheffersomyces coipomensis]|uniref:uncharacterized protein n=1 Tax=Scheffersomyces coipomensis TaxID=1788519 RepID=UPI00315CCB95